MVAQAEEAQAAAERVSNGTATAADRQTLADFQKTMAGVQGNANAAMAAMQEETALQKAVADSIKAKCGAEPKAPTLGGSAGAGPGRRAARRLPARRKRSTRRRRKRPGCRKDEYRLVREKAKGFALSNTEVQGGSDTPDDEAKAINQALAQTRALIDAGEEGERAVDVRAALAGIALAVAGLPAPNMGAGPALAVRAPSGWETWWQADAAPSAWRAPLPAVTDRVAWRQVAPGVERGEFSLSGDGEAFRVRVIVARLDPAQLEFRLVKPADGRVFAGRWAVDEAPDDAVFAINAGQFTDNRPWGWLVQDGVERQVPGTGPLAPAVVVDTTGALRLVSPDSIGLVKRVGPGGVPVVSDAAVG